MRKFKSCLDIANDLIHHYDNDKLLRTFNNNCEKTANPDSMVFYNDDDFLDLFGKNEIADYASYKYHSNDRYVKTTVYGFESSNRLRDLISKEDLETMTIVLLKTDNPELFQGISNYFQSLVKNCFISIQDWVDNIVFYHDQDQEKKLYGIDSSIPMLTIFRMNFSNIYKQSSERQVEHALKTIHERNDLFSENFIANHL